MTASETVRRRRRRRLRERGAVIIEGVIVFPLIFFCMMAIMETGLFFATSSTTNNAARDGARYASANFAISSDRRASAGQAIAAAERTLDGLTKNGTPVLAWVYEVNPATNNPYGTTNFGSCNTNCFQYTWNGTDFVYQAGTWTDPDACIGDGSIDSIGVLVRVNHATIAGLIENRTINQHTNMRLEPLPFNQCT